MEGREKKQRRRSRWGSEAPQSFQSASVPQSLPPGQPPVGFSTGSLSMPPGQSPVGFNAGPASVPAQSPMMGFNTGPVLMPGQSSIMPGQSPGLGFNAGAMGAAPAVGIHPPGLMMNPQLGAAALPRPNMPGAAAGSKYISISTM